MAAKSPGQMKCVHTPFVHVLDLLPAASPMTTGPSCWYETSCNADSPCNRLHEGSDGLGNDRRRGEGEPLLVGHRVGVEARAEGRADARGAAAEANARVRLAEMASTSRPWSPKPRRDRREVTVGSTEAFTHFVGA